MRLAIAVLALSATPALAQQPCAPSHAVMAEALTGGKYREQPTFMGITSGSGAKFELWLNPETGTWTATVEQPTGATCILMVGDSFGPAMPVKAGEGL
jgi:predicted butyrate kinase (DUF1464 family)